MKPDSRIYNAATERLGVNPQDCLYISDGGADGELAAALQVGMHPVQLLVSDDNDSDLHLEEWDGPTISSLKEVLDLLE
jgi:putative hydrolase of the HAD superfamily